MTTASDAIRPVLEGPLLRLTRDARSAASYLDSFARMLARNKDVWSGASRTISDGDRRSLLDVRRVLVELDASLITTIAMTQDPA